MDTWLPLIGRIFMVALFFESGIGKILHPSMTMGFMAQHGMPAVHVFLVLAILAELGGGLSVLLGFLTRWGAAVLVLFMILATLIFHAEAGTMMQRAVLLEHVSITGGILLLVSYGAGRWSLDAARAAKRA
jgi:putative oxidoreductase